MSHHQCFDERKGLEEVIYVVGVFVENVPDPQQLEHLAQPQQPERSGHLQHFADPIRPAAAGDQSDVLNREARKQVDREPLPEVVARDRPAPCDGQVLEDSSIPMKGRLSSSKTVPVFSPDWMTPSRS